MVLMLSIFSEESIGVAEGMESAKRSTIYIILVWLCIVPPGMIIVLGNNSPGEVNWLYVALFSISGFLSVRFPIVRNGVPLFLVMWITVPAFLMYGLFAEMVVMQFSLLAHLFVWRGKTLKLYRFCLFSLLFFFLSIISALAFHAVGGEVGTLQFWPIIFAAYCYQIVHSLFYHMIRQAYFTLRKRQAIFPMKSAVAETIMVLAILPLALTVYFLLQLFGAGTFFLIGIPFFVVTIIMYRHDHSRKINHNLQRAVHVGSGLSALLSEKEVIDHFMVEMSELFKTDYTYLFDHQDGWLELIRSYEQGQFVDIDFADLAAGQGIAGTVLEGKKPLIYKNRDEWEAISKDYSPDQMQSVLCIPISRNGKIEAVVFLASKKKAAFVDYQLKILDILCSYFTVNVEKARYMEEAITKSERCALTNLYNYRFLEDRLVYEYNRFKNHQLHDLSVVMLDIDHFKKVNDTYGHQSGNDILTGLARELAAMLPAEGILARYGGEEFVFLLPGVSKRAAISFAEEVRSEIAGHPFTITSDLDEENCQRDIHITLSMGVSAMPDDTDEAMALLRNADRALYIGAKQTGRNKVASYVK